MKWITKLLEEYRARQLTIQDRMVDLEKDMKLASAVIEIAAKEILAIKAILNKHGMNDTVLTMTPEQAEEFTKGPILRKVENNEQH